ncbi:MAG: phosphodiester glycosidase family protein [Ardenticatenaceae bacterium]|nr:phosphodiester glycosidase family protein [Ardenticatenaceae bacterium]
MKNTFFLLLWLLVGCGGERPLPTPVIPATVPPVLPTPTLLPTATVGEETAVSGWQPIQPGLEQRTINLFDNDGRQVEQLYLLRLEPAAFRLRVGYRPGAPLALTEWQAETGARLVVNGGFFTEAWQATGLTVIDGAASGVSYEGFGGMLAVTEAGAEVRGLAERPFDPAEPLLYALQSFPLLVRPDGTGFADEDNQPNRRTVVGVDRNGRFLFIIAPWGHFTLHQLSQYLLESDLDLDIALNLDGGTSTGLLLMGEDGGETAVHIPAFTPLPTVILVEPRGD